MVPEIQAYNDRQIVAGKAICDLLAATIDSGLSEAESKIWHAHPVWFLDGNPVVGYSKQKAGWRLMFWSGADFEEEELNVRGKKFKDASIFYTAVLLPDGVFTARAIVWRVRPRRIAAGS